ncbi:MAG: DNA recombination protein RmuC [Candidatus Omnitrophica bacterium]|nr:DNA recombination protein RmuC [Candidatus Omnitrophota bacterium]
MEKILWIVVILVFFLSGYFLLILKKYLFKETVTLRKETEERINLFSRQWSEALDRNTQLITSQLNSLQNQITQNLINASNVVQNVQKTLGKLEEGTKQIFEVGKDIASFQELLRQPKFRGEFGQFLLENVLEQIIPKEYYLLQYRFRNGETADAVIKIGENLVVVDAKFPLESFRRIIEAKIDTERLRARKDFVKAISKHIDDISRKYILPDEGTYDFALMYIPAENVYYETIIKENDEMELSIRDYALSKKVIPVSPNSFYAYLMVILRGLKGLTIEKRAKEVLEDLARLRNDFGKFSEEFVKTGMHLKNASQSYERAVINLEKLNDKFKQIETPVSDSEKVISQGDVQNSL